MEAQGPWLDGVHWLGTCGGIIAVLAGIGGLSILLVFRKGPIRQRLRIRTVHMLLGSLAVGLALAHVIGRLKQGWSPSHFMPHDWVTLAFPLILLAGWLRHRPPGVLQERAWGLAWAHRAAVILTLALLAWHVRYQMGMFPGS